ncbi:MAG: hypothetical protein GXO36_05525 [Chloroflexi bacterium]|nr:hypothetical protein [Chloroflexota bacterium]
MKGEAYTLLQETRQELGASVILIANEAGQALLYEGIEPPQTMDLLAALGAAGLSALQEIITASFKGWGRNAHQGDQILMLEVDPGIILILARAPFIFLVILTDKTRLGLARLLLRRLANQYPWERLLTTAQRHELPLRKDKSMSETRKQLFRDLWAR